MNSNGSNVDLNVYRDKNMSDIMKFKGTRSVKQQRPKSAPTLVDRFDEFDQEMNRNLNQNGSLNEKVSNETRLSIKDTDKFNSSVSKTLQQHQTLLELSKENENSHRSGSKYETQSRFDEFHERYRRIDEFHGLFKMELIANEMLSCEDQNIRDTFVQLLSIVRNTCVDVDHSIHWKSTIELCVNTLTQRFKEKSSMVNQFVYLIVTKSLIEMLELVLEFIRRSHENNLGNGHRQFVQIGFMDEIVEAIQNEFRVADTVEYRCKLLYNRMILSLSRLLINEYIETRQISEKSIEFLNSNAFHSIFITETHHVHHQNSFESTQFITELTAFLFVLIKTSHTLNISNQTSTHIVNFLIQTLNSTNTFHSELHRNILNIMLSISFQFHSPLGLHLLLSNSKHHCFLDVNYESK